MGFFDSEIKTQVYYDPKYNRFFHVIRKYPRSILIGCMTGFYDTISTSRYSIPKYYLKQCELMDNPNNKYTELDELTHSYKIKGYDCLVERDPILDKAIFKDNDYQSKVAQYRWDKKNDFWEFENQLLDDWG